MHGKSATEGHTSEHVANPRSISNRFWQSRAVSRRNVSQPESTVELAPPGSRKSQVNHASEVDRSFEETGTTTNRHRLGHPRQPIREEILRRDERDAKLVEAATDVLVHKVFRAHVSSRSLVFPGHPDVVPRMPSLVVLGGLHVFPKPPTDHPRRDIRHSSEYSDVKSTVGQSLDPAEIRQLLGRQKRGEFVELHAEVAELTTERAPLFRHGTPPRLKMRSCWDGGRQAANLRSPSQSVRNLTTWFQLGVTGDAGPEITNGLGAFLHVARSKPSFGQVLLFLPKCQDELSIGEPPVVTVWRIWRSSIHRLLGFSLGTAIAVPNGMPSPRHAVRRNARRGFTLLEILVVIALISLLTTGVAVGALLMLEESKKKQAKTDTASLASVAEAFVITHDEESCPTPEELSRDGLLSHRSNTEDPWGTPYRIRCEPSYAVGTSAGPDRAFDTGDDIHSDEP